MNHSFEVSERENRINGAIIIDAGRFAGIGIGLSDELAVDAQEKADLLERRLSRLEGALGFEAICDR
ncbi:hypothetical protein [Pseudomonas sp. 34 E 7]|uniref:hypothetical protein n=1 Tax=Pseudomonas sp. 34 E 7 TaxID=1844102 RepID=UPI0008120B23|nr:hypothetical protein [Pseudomonas sp. 34 E 7]CRN01186.1 hypothetical protein [Pseudomonas sp. 34 E 7]